MSREKRAEQEKKQRTFHPLRSLRVAFSLYSRIPMPAGRRREGDERYSLCFFPCVGVLIGILEVFFFYAAGRLSLGSLAFCCLFTAIPLLLTGGIHMDGFLDIADALSSFADREKKWQIVKDPHIGAFALIWSLVYLLFYLAAVSELKEKAFPAVAAVWVLTRAFSGFSVVAFPKSEKSSMVKGLSDGSAKTAVIISSALWAVISLAFVLFYAGAGAAVAAGVISSVCLFFFYELAWRQFGGVNGDLAGFFLQILELLLIFVFAIVCR